MPEQLNPDTLWLAYAIIVAGTCALMALALATAWLFFVPQKSWNERRYREWRRRELQRRERE